jgi:hypothetical protein
VSPHRRSLTIALALAASAFVAAACAEKSPTEVDDSPLAGLLESQATDSAGAPAPTAPPTSPGTPGYVRGVVRAPSQNAQPGQDTLGASTRIAGAIVTAHPYVLITPDSLGPGPQVAQVVTNANGEFQLPTLPGGQYVITFSPPASLANTYGGVWTTGPIHDKSHEHPWWVTLWKK